jgi:hypothetical protein
MLWGVIASPFYAASLPLKKGSDISIIFQGLALLASLSRNKIG